MAIYDYIIVGGGISGVYMSYVLSKINQHILLVESSNRLGGRIYTLNDKDHNYELGAARIGEKHTKLLSLIEELGLGDKLIELPSREKVNYIIKSYSDNFMKD